MKLLPMLKDQRQNAPKSALFGLLLLLSIVGVQLEKFAGDPPPIWRYDVKSAQKLQRECADFEQHVLCNITSSSAFDGDRTIVQMDDLRIVYESKLTRNGLLCLKEKIGVTVLRFPAEECSHGELNEREDSMPTTPEIAYVSRVMYVGYGGFMFVYVVQNPVVKYAFRFRFPPEFRQNTKMGLTATEYVDRLCNIMKLKQMKQMMEQGILNSFQVLAVTYTKKTDVLTISGMSSRLNNTWHDSIISWFSLNAYKNSTTFDLTKDAVNNYWLGVKEGITIYQNQINRQQPRLVSLLRRSTEMMPLSGVDTNALVLHNMRMTTMQWIGCPIHMCWRADLDGVLVDEFDVIQATNDPGYRYDIKMVQPTSYLYSASFFVKTKKLKLLTNGTFEPIDMKTSPILFDPLSTLDRMVPSWSKEQQFPVSCQVDGMFMRAASTATDMAEKQDARVAWYVFKDSYVYIAYFQMDLTSNDFSSMNQQLLFRLSELKDVFPNAPTFVESAAALHKAVFLFHGKWCRVTRTRVTTLKLTANRRVSFASNQKIAFTCTDCS
jgi:hypothetical protein